LRCRVRRRRRATGHAAAGQGFDALAVIGDTGTGGKEQYEIGKRLEEYREQANFTFTIMVGDNIYGSERPQDFQQKFELPYKPLLDAGVTFLRRARQPRRSQPALLQAVQHGRRTLLHLHEGQHRFLRSRFELHGSQAARLVRARDQGLEVGLEDGVFSTIRPIRPAPRHGSEVDLRAVLEPLFVKYGVNVVFAGHEHFYERLKPQQGIYYFNVRRVGEAPQRRHPEELELTKRATTSRTRS
jgi:hypothetical protein